MVSLQPRLNLKVSQRQVLTPGLVQMVSVLALNKLELKEMINAEIVENPVLEEIEENIPVLDEIAREEAGHELTAEQVRTEAAATEKDPFDEIDFGSYFQDYLDPGFRSPTNFEVSEKPSFEHFLSQPSTLTDHLYWQLGSLNLSSAVRLAAELIIGNLNEEGYLSASDDELLDVLVSDDPSAEALPLPASPLASAPATAGIETVFEVPVPEDPNGPGTGAVELIEVPATTAQAAPEPVTELVPAPPLTPEQATRRAVMMFALDQALTVVRGLDPPGIAGRDLRECLLLQINARRREAAQLTRAASSREAARDTAFEAGGIEDRERDPAGMVAAAPDGFLPTSPVEHQSESAAVGTAAFSVTDGSAPYSSPNGYHRNGDGRDPGAASPPIPADGPVLAPAIGVAGRGAEAFPDPSAVFDLAARIVSECLNLLQKRDMRELSRALGRPVPLIQQAVDCIRTLDPRPGRRYNREEARLIEPDVAFIKRGDEYIVAMNEEDLPSLRLNQGYRRMLTQEGTEKDVKEYVKERYKSAIQLMRNIEQRKNTILRTCEVIVRRQADFLEHGVEALHPMMIKEVAEEIGVHPSTVSRAVSNKYVHTPQGVYELRFFFSEGVNGPEGAGTPLLLLKRKVKKIIDEEDQRRPLTDDVIAQMLQEQGINVTRRTVAKYREDLNIPSTHQRRVRD